MFQNKRHNFVVSTLCDDIPKPNTFLQSWIQNRRAAFEMKEIWNYWWTASKWHMRCNLPTNPPRCCHGNTEYVSNVLLQSDIFQYYKQPGAGGFIPSQCEGVITFILGELLLYWISFIWTQWVLKNILLKVTPQSKPAIRFLKLSV